MRHIVAALLVAALLIGLAAPAAHAGNTAGKVALGLASFAVFSQLVNPYVYARPAYAYPPVYVTTPPPTVIYAPPVVATPPAYPTIVQYPHGRYELRWSGMNYYWAWIPSAPPPPPPAAADCKFTGKYVKTPQGVLPECE